jgi:TP901 family phage tail tape measure protein
MQEFTAEILITAADKASHVFKKVGGEAKGLFGTLDRLGSQFMKVGTVLTGAITVPLVAFGVKAVEAARHLEELKLELAKELDVPTDQFDKITEQLRDIPLHLPTTTEQVFKLATAAKEMGVAADDLAAFSEEAVKMGLAFGISSEQAGLSLAHMGKSGKLSVDQLKELADVIQYTADTFNDSETGVLSFTEDTLTMGKALGITGKQLALWGAGMESTGMTAEQSTAAFSFGLKKMVDPKTMDKFVKNYGLNAKKFGHLLKTDMNGAMMEVLKTIAKLPSAGRQAEALKLVFGKQGAALLPLLKQLGLIQEETQKIADGAAQADIEGKVAPQVKSFDSQLQILDNHWTHLKENLGAPILDVISPWLASFNDQLNEMNKTDPQKLKDRIDLIIKLAVALAALGPGVLILGTLFKTMAAISKVGGFFGGGGGFKGFIVGTAILTLTYFAVRALWEKWDEVSAKTVEAGGHIKDVWGDLTQLYDNMKNQNWSAASVNFLNAIADMKLAMKSLGDVSKTIMDQMEVDMENALPEPFGKWLHIFDEFVKKYGPMKDYGAKPEAPLGPVPVVSHLGAKGTVVPHFYDVPMRSKGRDYVPAGGGDQTPFQPILTPPWATRLMGYIGDLVEKARNRGDMMEGPHPSDKMYRGPLPLVPGVDKFLSDMSNALAGKQKTADPEATRLLQGILINTEKDPTPPKATLEGKADVVVRVQVTGGQVTGTSAVSSGNVQARVGVDNTAAPARMNRGQL